MEAGSTVPSTTPPFEPNIEVIRQRLLKNGVYPNPKIIRALRKKQIQKHNRKITKVSQAQLTASQKQALAEESHFQTLTSEYRTFTKAIKGETRSSTSGLLVGRPWERIERVKLREIVSGSNQFNGNKLNVESLRELKENFEDGLNWVLDNDIELENNDDWLSSENQWQYDPAKRRRNDKEEIRFLVDRLSKRDVTVRDWKLAKIMKQSGLRFSEGQLMKIVEGLGNKGKWEQAMAVVEWVYNDKERRDSKSRFVYTKLLSVLRIERRPKEALRIFNSMREDHNLYPDMAAYHVIAVTLGQAGNLKELLKIVECMKQQPSKRINKMCYKRWDPVLEPDIVIYNAVLNACVPTQQWKGVAWVFEQLRKSGLKPNGATYGLAMEVMLNSGKYDLVHELFRKMNRSGEAPKALTYKAFSVLVRAFWEEGKVNEAMEAVRDMENRGVVGTASLYYELACCLCYYGMWQDAMLEVKKMKNLRHSKPLEVTFTGLIMSSLDGGHVSDCISIFEYMKAYCVPNIGTINIMLKVYGRNDLFSKAKELFGEIKGTNNDGTYLVPDEFTYSSMLEASASALQWEYFELVYKEMTFCGYQLDQKKHASLLVEASRVGKYHLLEHAFDAALEAGEIPHHLLFTEMVFQATAQQNYERAVVLVNTLALAPFKISEKQWIDLFQKNGDKITQDGLEKLLDALRSSDVASEPTVANLSRTLHSLCGRGRSEYLSGSTSLGIDVTNSSYLDSGSRKIMGDKGPEMHEDTLIDKTDIAYGDLSVTRSNTGGEGSDDTDEASSSPRNYSTDRDGIASICTNVKIFGDDEASGASTDCLDFDEMEYGIPINQVDDSCGTKLPSADEILDIWKESRKGRLFFPFQLHKNEPTSVPKNVNEG
ncbi:pentatricopeptide repeat-containing protein At5g67570, chloroplastic isoform X1 [Ricinus communis]|uniref:pentatricopeptide repeat-containing protein At5g67570, chloroplastic isoform X1 n=1 Tax=Ricinus communis TaxID=3988 RepID=UPI00201A67A2|nr:pentatricopeptide repeat-containing protein At5g67570, chloroplastic isoform X1 [Ricinus communis]